MPLMLPNPDGEIPESNPLFKAVDLADACGNECEARADTVRQLAASMLGDAFAETRNPAAFAVLYGELLSLMPRLGAFADASTSPDVLSCGVADFIWAYAFDAYDHACEILGNDADRHHSLAYAHIVAGFFRSIADRMHIEMAASRGARQ